MIEDQEMKLEADHVHDQGQQDEAKTSRDPMLDVCSLR